MALTHNALWLGAILIGGGDVWSHRWEGVGGVLGGVEISLTTTRQHRRSGSI